MSLPHTRPVIDETMLNMKQIHFYCKTTALLLGSINHPTVCHAKCPPWKWWAHLCTRSVRRWRKRAVLRGNGVLPPRGGAQTKQHERRLQAETLRANTAQAALSKRRPPHEPPPTAWTGPWRRNRARRLKPVGSICFSRVFIAGKTLSTVLALAFEAKLG